MSRCVNVSDYPAEMQAKMHEIFEEAFNNPCFDCVNYLECGSKNKLCKKFKEEEI